MTIGVICAIPQECAYLRNVLSGVRREQIAHITFDAGELDAHHDDFGALAIEMEGGALAQVCEAFDIPWLVIRALSDLAGADSGVDFNLFAEEVAISSARVLLRLLSTLG